MMQHALAATLGRAGAAWSLVRLPSSRIIKLTGSGCAGAAAKPGRLIGTREALSSWFPIRAASQEASSEMALEKKKCIPCETGKLQPLSEEKAHSLLPEVAGWELKEIDGVLQLHRSWKAKSFVKGLEIMKRVADVAEAEGHHPDLHLVNWNQLSINMSTHAVGGLTENDFIVAAKIGALDLTDLVRKPKAVAK
ncbi:hypothetical protein M758_12G152400 [Ceratodon purpureus]|nr:hypothetical protein M758_12G152400 [Ceratodon purpureus]